jgi:hypothetical protein
VLRAELLCLSVLLLGSGAQARPADAPLIEPATAPRAAAAPTAWAPSRTARILTESATAVLVGVGVSLAAYAGFTALQSFVGFLVGFLSATVIGAVLAPIGVVIAGRLMGAEGGTGRAVVGALIGLAVGLLIGLPLATLPSAAYLLGLGLLWALPSIGALVAFEWGRQEPAALGVTVLRF